MGSRELVTIHANPSIGWHAKRLPYFVEGLERLGKTVITTDSPIPINEHPAVIFGTTCFQQVRGLLVDRAGYGDPDFVRLAWDGVDHRVPKGYTSERFESHNITLEPMRTGSRVVLCGDYEALPECEGATHYKPHPQSSLKCDLPVVSDFSDCGLAVTGRSSVAIELWRSGVPIHVTNPKGLAYGWTDRKQFFDWLAWTQWTWTEIREGIPHLWHQK